MIKCLSKGGLFKRGTVLLINPDHIYLGGYFIKDGKSILVGSGEFKAYVRVGDLTYCDDSGFYHECATAWEEL